MRASRMTACWALLAGAASFPAMAANDAVFVSQSVPGNVTAGAQFTAEVTLQNTGSTTWTLAAGYFLGSQNPMDNSTWGTNRFFMNGADSVAPGASYTFSKSLTAPAQAGDYDFEWQALQDAVEWFGQKSPNLTVHVAPAAGMTCDGTETFCLTLNDSAAILATGATLGGDVSSTGFMPADQGGLDWHFGPTTDISAGRLEVDVTGLLPQTDASQPDQVSIFEVCGEGAGSNQVLGLQRMMLGYHGNNIFRYYATTDFTNLGWQLGIWTDGFEATGWTAGQTHHFVISWASGGAASIGLDIDGQSWNNSGTLPFDAPDKVLTLGARCTHYPSQQAVARFSNLRLWILGNCGNNQVDPGETCDGNCPASCDDANACTTDVLTGSAATCNAACAQSAVTACASGDGCCPAGCSAPSDNDCPPGADAGAPPDGGIAPDGGGTSGDAGVDVDAGTGAGAQPDAGATSTALQGSCGCSAPAFFVSAAQLAWLGIATLGLRRRRGS